MDTKSGLHHVTNPPNPWQETCVDFEGMPPPLSLKVLQDNSRQILTKNTSPDLPFRWSLNPYRGCYHACAYCYARPSHHYLDLGSGTDFEQTLIVKPKAPTLLREAFNRRSWRGEPILMSGNTDPYQPLEVSYGLTRGCLEVCRDYRNPVSIITKSTLVERDLSLLVDLNQRARCTLTISVPFSDPRQSRIIEPRVPSPRRRMKTIARLSAAGLRVRVNIAPVIPGLNDQQIPSILEAAREAGAREANFILLRLPQSVAQVFEERLRKGLPERAERILTQIRACRGGALNTSRFGERMVGLGPRYRAIESLFLSSAKRLGLRPATYIKAGESFSRPHEGHQLGLL